MSRYGEVFRSVRTRERKRFHWLRKKWVAILLAVVMVLGGIGGFGLWYYYSLQGDMQVEIPEVGDQEAGEPFNALLVGSDSREGLTEKEQQDLGADDVDPVTGQPITGERADTLIIAHIDPATERVTMVQFPRDYWIERADGTEGRINEALNVSKSNLVRTVEKVTGIEIHVYAQVNIAGFKDLVDAIDGVEICIAEPIPFDPATGIEVKPEEVGMVHFDGDRAIRFVRSRKVFSGGDLDRVQNQQKFLAAAIEKLTRPSTFLSFGRLLELKRIAGRNIKIDSHTSLRDLYDLMKRFRAFDPEHYEAYTAPNLGTGTVGEASVVLPDLDGLEVLAEAIRANESPAEADGVPDIDPSTIRVGVYNGTFKEGRAAAAADELKAATATGGPGVEIADVANADRFNYRGVTIQYTAQTATMAELVAAAIPDAEMVEVDQTTAGVDVEVIVGRGGFRAEKIVQVLPIPLPKPSALPKACRT